MKSHLLRPLCIRIAAAAIAAFPLATRGAEPASTPATTAMLRLDPGLILVVPDSPPVPPKTEKPAPFRAAERLAMLLEKATGLAPKIVTAAQAPAEGARIFVGYGRHLEGKVTPPAKPEGLKIQEIDGNVYLLGEIAPPGTVNNKAPLDRGVMHAVETFAEQVLGFRFLFSSIHKEEVKNNTFELGTVIPKLAHIEVPKGLLIEDAPVFTHRIMSSRPRSLIGLREGSASGFYANHSYDMGWWANRFAKSDPDMFIPRNAAGGGNNDQAVEAMQSQPNLAWLDFTHPKVLETRLQEIEKEVKGGRGGGFHYRPNQRYVIEETPDSAAPSVQYNERSRALFDPKHHAWGNFSNIWFDYLNRMSPEVRKRFPGMRIATLAYMRHYGLPTFPLEDNIDVMMTCMRTSMGNKEPEVFDKNLADVRKWSEKLGNDRNRMFLWEYGCWPAFWKSTPVICPNAMRKWLKAVQPHVSGVFMEMYQPNEYYFMMRRLWMRLLWNPDLDVNAEIDDLSKHFFGPAGATMAEFYKLLIERYEMPWTNPKLTWDQYYLDNNLYFGQSYTPEVTDRLAGLMEKARREAGIAPGFAGNLVSGTAVHVNNPGGEPEPLGFSIEAGEEPLTAPSVVWEGGRYQLRARLMPGERLDIAPDGSGKIVTATGESRSADLAMTGDAPVLAPGQSQLIRFRKQGGNPRTEFRAVVRQGDQTADTPEQDSIYARRLLWMSRPHRVLPPENAWGNDISNPARKDTNTGFLAHARWFHQANGMIPAFAEPAVEDYELPEIKKAKELAETAQAALKRASKLKGPENQDARDKEIAIARQAFPEAIKLYPEWKLEEVDPKNPWSVVGARVTRAGIYNGIGEHAKALEEFDAALKATGKQRDAKSYVEMLIGDTYQLQENWAKAEEFYLKAQKTGLYGDRQKQVPQRLEEVRKKMAGAK